MLNGILPIFKPMEITSYDVIRQVKKMLPKGHKIGHAGTLDPFADGVLILLLGKATKKFDEIRTWKKTYIAVARLGYKSDTLDREGKISKSVNQLISISEEDVQKIADKFIGEIEQVIPLYSAAKYNGKPLYKYARKGDVTPEKSKKVMIHQIKVIKLEKENVEIEVTCGSGTYIRQLSYDIFKQLGIESYLEKLTRTQVGAIAINDCKILDSEDILNIRES